MTTTLNVRKNTPLTIGPGYAFSLSTNMVGGPPPGAKWAVTISRPGSPLEVITRFDYPITTPAPTLFTWDVPGQGELIQGDRSAADLTTTDLSVQMITSTGSPVIGESASSLGVTYDATGLIGDTVHQIPAPAITVDALTPAQAAQLASSDVASQLSTSLVGLSQLAAGVPDALTRPAYYFQCTELAALSLSGTGSLILPVQTKTSIVCGMTWNWTVVPPGAGRRNGFVTEYSGRPLQLVTQFQLDHNLGATVWDEVTDWAIDRVAWTWRRVFPSAVGYWLQPGFEADFRWLRFCLLP